MALTETTRTVVLPSGEQIPRLGQGTWHMAENPLNRTGEVNALRLGIDQACSRGRNVFSQEPLRSDRIKLPEGVPKFAPKEPIRAVIPPVLYAHFEITGKAQRLLKRRR